MPATFAHPAAALPLAQFCPAHLDFAALVIGSMTPDIGYFSRSFEVATAAHSFAGSLTFCLPARATLYLIFLILREPFTFLLPNPHRAALGRVLTTSTPIALRRIPIIIISLLLGAWTHIIWDSFTHAGSWLAQRIPLLREPILTLGGQTLPVAYFLQQLSTVAGVLLLTIAYLRWLRRDKRPDAQRSASERWRYALWIGSLFLPICAALPAAAHRANQFSGYLALRVFVFREVIYSIAMIVPLVTAAASLVLICQRKRDDHPAIR